MAEITVAIPVRDGGERFAAVLAALARQTVAHELLVCDSGSRDGSLEVARAHGARVLEIAPSAFSHGGVRNTLMAAASGTHVALLTQDAEPADTRWLAALLAGFELGSDVALVYGPYLPRPDASLAVRLELEAWFNSLSPDRTARVDRLSDAHAHAHAHAPAAAASELVGRLGFFTDANACLARAAWERVPFRALPYAEDRALAADMLRAGYAKAFVPDAAVIHSHDYGSVQQLRRSFDEWRGLLEVYGWREPCSPMRMASQLRAALARADRRLREHGAPAGERVAKLAGVTRHELIRLAGAQLGSRADRLPAPVRTRLSLERRGSIATPPQADSAGDATDRASRR